MDGRIASMTEEIILITGGARSGKSRCAEQRARRNGRYTALRGDSRSQG